LVAASQFVDSAEVEAEASVAASQFVDSAEVEAEALVAASQFVDSAEVEPEAPQIIINQDVEEYGDQDLSLDFGEEDEDAPLSLNITKASEAEEYDETSDDLRLNFWEDWDEVADESAIEKKLFDERTQLRKLKGLSEKDKRERRERQDVENSTQNTETRRRKETEKDARRQKEKKRKNATSSDAEYYEPFSRMEPETLDGLYDYFGDFDAICDEIETERIIDYYDRTYGDARYRDESEEWE